MALQHQLLQDERVDAHLIDVETLNGIVTLSGSVDNLLAKDQAVQIAESIKGVRAIVNRIAVSPVIRPDNRIYEDVKAALMSDPVTFNYDIEVNVSNGIVNLSGEIKSWAAKQLAAQVVKGVVGIVGIENRISINYDAKRFDYEIKKEIEGRLILDPYIDENQISVKAKDGRVTLSGVVGSAAVKSRAYNKSWVLGVSSVDISNLDVAWQEQDQMLRQSTIAIRTNERIKQAVEEAFQYDPRVSHFHTVVAVENGTVTLVGTVDNLEAKRAAEEDALNTIGVWRVRNYLNVHMDNPPADSAIAQNVRSALKRDPVVERQDIDVKVTNRTVYLTGTVDSYYERKRAADVASGEFGVVDVQNNLMVRHDRLPKSDREIKEDIEQEFFWSIFVDHDDVSVRVKDGTATLTGTVDNRQELKAAVENAFEGGARRVRSRLTSRNGNALYGEYDHP